MQAPVGVYVRVSRKGDREDERFHSPREQAERATALAVAKGYEPGPVFEDINVSGGTEPMERPGMRALLEAIARGELEDRRAALGLYWKAVRVGRRNGTGTPITFVARGPLAEAELELPAVDVDELEAA